MNENTTITAQSNYGTIQNPVCASNSLYRVIQFAFIPNEAISVGSTVDINIGGIAFPNVTFYVAVPYGDNIILAWTDKETKYKIKIRPMIKTLAKDSVLGITMQFPRMNVAE